jgi:hypothetical protein
MPRSTGERQRLGGLSHQTSAPEKAARPIASVCSQSYKFRAGLVQGGDRWLAEGGRVAGAGGQNFAFAARPVALRNRSEKFPKFWSVA